MKTTIWPVCAEETNLICAGFFLEEFIEERLGEPGRWLGSSAERRGLTNPVQGNVFDAYLSLEGAQVGRRPEEPVAWHIVFEPGSVSTTLWALANKEARDKFEKAHSEASDIALSCLESWLTDNVPERPQHELGGVLFATFVSGTDDRKLPRLRTDAFLMNFAYDTVDAKFTTFSNDRVVSLAQRLEGIYADYFRCYRENALGCFDRTVCNTVRRAALFEDSHTGLNDETAANKNSLDKEQLFLAWQKEGAARGFGPKQADALLRYAKGEQFRCGPEQSISKPSEQKSKSQDHGHSR